MLKTDPSTWTDARHREGARAEQLAADVMRRDGYHILEQRFRYRRHDIDLVARRGNVVVFVEVRFRARSYFGTAAESVDGRKRRLLVQTAAAWLQRFGCSGDVCRFDVVTVEGARVNWIQSAFRPLWR